MKKRFIAAVTALILSLFSGCTLRPVSADNLTDGIKPDAVPVYNNFNNGENVAVSDFAAKLLQQSFKDDKSSQRCRWRNFKPDGKCVRYGY